MKLHVPALAALCLGLAVTPLAFAQTTGSTGGAGAQRGGNSGITPDTGSSGGADSADYLTGPGIRAFYNDQGMTKLRTPQEIRLVYGNMTAEARARLRAACAAEYDPRYDQLCASVGAM
jgi:hypothetical protein